MNRRDALRRLRWGFVGSAAASLLAPGHPLLAAAKPKPDRRPVALLLPLSGPRATLGLSMRHAAMLAETDPALMIAIDTAPGIGAAAAEALKRKVALILGPLTADETREAANIVGGAVPIVAFTNDAGAGGDAYVFGLTPAQTTSAVLRYARSRGIKSVVTIADGSPWSTAAAATAARMQGELGIDVRAIAVTEGGTLPAAGDAPDAVLVPGSGDAVLAAARGLKDTGVQLLGTVQALDHRPAALEALDGAWLASPDPAAFGTFSASFEAQNGGAPGVLAALAYDAAKISRTLRDAHRLDRAGLLGTESFACVTGAARFRTDGSCARELAILVARRDGYQSVATSRGA